MGRNGRKILTFALLDSCSDVTLVSEDLAKDLGLRGQQQKLTLNTLSSPTSLMSSCVSLSVYAHGDPEASPLFIKDAWTRPGTFKCPPVRTTDLQHMLHLKDLGLSDVMPSEVKLLIGANAPRAHLQIECREGLPHEPVAVRTLLGWCILGASDVKRHDEVQANVNLVLSEEVKLNEQLEKFWATESFGVSVNLKKPTSFEDQRSERIMQSGIKLVDGHYEVPMLWRESEKKLPNNRQMAEKRFTSLMKRLSMKPELKENYMGVVNGYVSNGYARKLTSLEKQMQPSKIWYLPHHYVTNPNKPGKLRVVFDAAAKLGDVSLNSELMSGPDFTNSLFCVLQRFRLHPIAIVADITEMFHQVKVAPEDTDALRFLWKENLDAPGPPQVFKMLVHIFGAKDSPSCVNFALRRTVDDASIDVDIKETVLENFYVDDMLKSVKDVSSALSLIDGVSHVLLQGGFKLAKWMSSSKEVLRHISQSASSKGELNLDFEDLPTQRVLGLGWNVKDDCFVFNPSNVSASMTKRSIISMVSSIYDPCGFITPFTFRAKCLIQEVWRSGADWDDTVSEELQERWRIWLQELHYLTSLRIPRYHGFRDGMTVQLHIFCDASEAGFAAVAYLRMMDGDVINCSFLAARSHVAPIKHTLTIPKLELQGALMGVRLSCALSDVYSVFNPRCSSGQMW